MNDFELINLCFPENCYHRETFYDHGVRTSPKACMECICEDGAMMCKQKDPKIVCPPLSCPTSQQFSVSGECCKFCPGKFDQDLDVIKKPLNKKKSSTILIPIDTINNRTKLHLNAAYCPLTCLVPYLYKSTNKKPAQP